jgi:hypothetical protein
VTFDDLGLRVLATRQVQVGGVYDASWAKRNDLFRTAAGGLAGRHARHRGAVGGLPEGVRSACTTVAGSGT